MATGIDRNAKPLISDPLRNFRFLVRFRPYWDKGDSELDELGISRSVQFGFTSVSGLSVATEAIPYREGGMNTTLHQIPGQTTFSPITLSRGVHMGRSEAWYWMKKLFAVTEGANGPNSSGDNLRTQFRAAVEIHVLAHPASRFNDGSTGSFIGAKNDPVAVAFKVHNAWIQSIAYSDLNAGDNAVLVEQMVLAHEGFQMAWPQPHDNDSETVTFASALPWD
jgi:phage tail-like protein